MARPEIVFGIDASSSQAETMGINSRVPFTEPKQLKMYVYLRRLNVIDSDQVLYAAVLDQTGGASEVFQARYPHINFERVATLRPPENPKT